MQVNIDHPQAAAIAAFYSGKGIRVPGGYWLYLGTARPTFTQASYEIEPEVVVKYSPVMLHASGTHAISAQFDTIELAKTHRDLYTATVFIDKYMKYEYIDGVLTNVSLVSE